MPNKRPAADEFAPYYAKYVDRVPTAPIMDTLRSHGVAFTSFITSIPGAKENFAYAPGKWTVKDLVQHTIDTERVMAYRALRIARGDTIPLPGFDENAWAPNTGANARNLSGLADELAAVRKATLALFANLPAEAWSRRGTASDQPVTTRGLAYIVVGHLMHHEAILRERYLDAK